jgi:hypothetical protein
MLPMATVSSPMSESPIARNLRVKKALQEGRDVNTAKTAKEREFENTVKELSGAGSAERIYNNPKKTAVGTAKALANIAALPVGVGQGLSEVVRGKEFNMGNNPLTGGKYSEGFNEALDVATVLPAVGLLGKGVRAGKAAIETSKDVGLLSNAHKLNPLAFKPNKSNWYRQVGKSAIDDALKTGVIREAGEEVSPRMLQEFQDQLVRMQGNGMEAALASRRPASPFFGKGELFYPMNRKPVINKKTGKLSKNPAGAGSADHLIETSLPNESFQPAYVKGMGLGVPTEVGQTAILKPDPNLRNLENFNLYKKDWLQGYKKENLKKYQLGTVFVNSAQDPRNLAFIDSTEVGRKSMQYLQQKIKEGSLPNVTDSGRPVRRIEDLLDIDSSKIRSQGVTNFGVVGVKSFPKGDPAAKNERMPRTGLPNKPAIVIEGPYSIREDLHQMPKQEVVVRPRPTYTSVPIINPNISANFAENDALPTTTKIPNSISFAKSRGSFNAKGLSRFNKETNEWEKIPEGWFNKGEGKGIENLPKFELGGAPPERKPRVITNLKDFKVAEEAYNDSLTLHNYGENTIKLIKAATKYIPGKAPGFEVAQKAFKSLEDLNGVAPSSFDQYWKRWRYSDGRSESMSAGHFTKPVQPVIYKPVVDTTPKPPKPPTKESAVIQKKVEQTPGTIPPSITAPTPIVKKDIEKLMMPSGSYMQKDDFIKKYGESAWRRASGQK